MTSEATEAVVEGPKFQLEHIGGLCTLNDEIVYQAATHLFIQNVATKSQRLVESGEITAMAINPARGLIGAAEKGTGVVKFFDSVTLQCKRKLIHESMFDILHISMSKDATRCLVLGGLPDYNLTMWDMERSTANASIRLTTITKKEIISADVSPTDRALVSVIDNKLIWLFMVSVNGKFVSVKTNLKAEAQNYSAQTWLASSGELVVGTEASETGSLVVMGGKDKETKQILKIEYAVRSLSACPRGFVVECHDGTVLLFQRSNKRGCYELTRSMHIKEKAAISGLATMKIEDGPNCDLICLSQSHSIVKIPLILSDGEGKELEIVPSFNASPRQIDSLVPDLGFMFVDCCGWKSLVAIGGYDGVLRIFDYRTHEVVLMHRFDERICGLSFHLTGEYLLVSTSTSMFLCSVLTDKLSISWQINDLQEPPMTCFLHGGHFAIALGTIVQVHDLYSASFSHVSTLRGHSKSIIEFSFRGHRDKLITIGEAMQHIDRCMHKRDIFIFLFSE